MRKLSEVISDFQNKGQAIGHFNVATLEMFNAVIDAAKATELPVIVGVSEGERDFMGIDNVVTLVRTAQAAGLEVYLNADHTYSAEKCQEAIDAGFDAVIADGAKLNYEENVALVKEVVAYAQTEDREVLVEAELGYIGSGSSVIDKVPDGQTFTVPSEAKDFVDKTGINLLAPSIGNMHGMFAGGRNPGELQISLIEELVTTTGIPMVLHGGSGTSDEDFVAAAKAGCAIIHVSTELRVAYKQGMRVAADHEQLAPYKYLQSAKDEVQKVVADRMRLFAGQ